MRYEAMLEKSFDSSRMSFCATMASYSVVPLLGFILALCLLDYQSECCFYNMIHHAAPIAEGEPPKSFGDPLYLTPILKTYYKKMAKRFSAVENLPNTTSDVQALESYSGFLTVNETQGSHLFFWFFPAMHNKESVPLIIWLQGGPGFSSMIGIFAENGPLKVHYARGKVTLRETTWVKTMNVLYIDSPVGSGFSHTHNDKDYARDESQITAHLMNAIEQFFSIFEDYRSRNIYIAGEGYSCKSVFDLAYELHSTEGGKHKLDLEGIILGNGICDWKMLTNHSYLLQNTGLINDFQAKLMTEKSSKIQKLFQTRNFDKAFNELAGMFKDQPSETSLFRNMTGYESLYDFSKSKIPEDLYMYTTYLAQKEVRRSLHVGLTPFGSHDKVCQHMTIAFGIPIQPKKLLTLLRKYKTLFYHGRRDLLVPYSSFLHFLNGIHFDGTGVNAFEQPFSERFNWFRKDKDKGQVFAGHVYQLDDIITVILWNAGHFAAYDDPKAVYDMVENFVFEKSFKD